MSMSVCACVVTTLNDTDLKLLEHCELKAATKSHQVYSQLIQLTRVNADRQTGHGWQTGLKDAGIQ